MRNTTFCLLLAAVLMMFGAVTVRFIKSSEAEGNEMITVSAETAETGWEFPVWGMVSEAFGAMYSEEYGQWTLRDYAAVKIDGEEMVCAPIDGVIDRIEGLQEGSCITLVGADATIRIWPVKEVRVFENSRVESGTILGSAQEKLYMKIEVDGSAVNPEDVFNDRNAN